MTYATEFVSKSEPWDLLAELHDDPDIYYTGPENEIGSLRVEIVESHVGITNDYLEWVEEIARYPVVAGKRYSFETWTRSEQMNWVGTVGVRWYDANGDTNGNFAITADFAIAPLEWVFMQGAYWAPDGTVEAGLALHMVSKEVPDMLDTIWFDEMVFKDEQVAPPTEIANPSFDTDIAGWVIRVGSIAGEIHHEPVDGVNAPGCLAVHVTDLTTTGIYADVLDVINSTQLPAIRSQTFTLGAYVKTDNIDVQPAFFIQNYNVHGQPAGGSGTMPDQFPANQWVYYEEDIHVTYSGTVAISIAATARVDVAAAVGTVFFDDFRVTSYTEPITVSHWDLWTSTWVSGGVFFDLAITHSDNGSVRIDLVDEGDTPYLRPVAGANFATLTERILVQPDRDYQVEGWVYSDDGQWLNSLGIQWYTAAGDTTGGYPGYMIPYDPGQALATWVYMSGTTTTPSDAAYGLLILHAIPTVDYADGSAWFDEVRVIDMEAGGALLRGAGPETLDVEGVLPDDVSDAGQQLAVLPTRWYV